MTVDQNRRHLNQILEALADELDVPPSRYEEAREHYDAVGRWLGEDDSDLAPFDPQIYAQGSFALGTAVRPLGDEEYDVDAVCLLDLSIDQVTQRELKEMIGRRLKEPGSRYKNKLQPADGGRRCWTIRYAADSHFHLDVLPCIRDADHWRLSEGVPPEAAEHAIRLTDKSTPEYDTGWPTNGHDPTRSNPKGYAAWFKDRMRVRLHEAKMVLAGEIRASVEDIEDYQVRTPLQLAVQVLKRHRDIRYNGDDDKPISVIITTLAARAYDNEANLCEAMLNIVPRMREHIEVRNGVWWVENPVNIHENFADKWHECPRKAELFLEWLDTLEREYLHILTDRGFESVGTYLEASYGQREGRAAITRYASQQVGQSDPTRSAPLILVPTRARGSTNPAYTSVSMPQPSKPWQP